MALRNYHDKAGRIIGEGSIWDANDEFVKANPDMFGTGRGGLSMGTYGLPALHRLHTGLGSRSHRYVCWTIRRSHTVTASASSVRATTCQIPSRST